jgi:Mg-chelatase subunit ChlD
MGRLYAGAIATAIIAAIGLSGATSAAPCTGQAGCEALAVGSPCQSVIARDLTPAAIRLCERSDVVLQLRPHCPGQPLNVVFVLSAYSNPRFEHSVRAWTSLAIDALEMSTHPNVKVGIVYWRFDGQVLLDLTNDEKLVRDASQVQGGAPFWEEGMCVGCALRKAAQVLRGTARGDRNVIVFIGHMYLGEDPQYPHYGEEYRGWFQGALTAKSSANPFVVACPYDPGCKNTSDWWTAASPGYYFEGVRSSPFSAAIAKLVKQTMRADLAAVSVTDRWTPGVELVPGSAAPVPALAAPLTRRLRWDIAAPITQALTLTYQVRPLAIGTHTFAGGQLVITDSLQQTNVLPLPTGILTVTGPCDPPTPTPTPVPPPTYTPTATSPPEPPTLTPTPPRATPSPAPTATRAPRPVFLPLTLREHCVPGQKRVDVVLVIDASTSMLERTSSGRSKLAAAQAAAAGFLDQLHLAQGDQAAVIAFNDAARVLQELSDDRSALDVALGRIAVAPTTRLDLAIESAHGELVGRRHRPGNAAVAIVLTDGKANPVGPDVAVARARLARDAGVTLFTIGLGDDLDDWALAAIASRATYYYRAPDAEALASIYAAIAVEIPCPAEGYWGGDPR